ncbi:MAG TPA: TIR domain-containing protein [Humisphaera sp.]
MATHHQMNETPHDFLRELAGPKWANGQRWLGLVWWYTAHQRSDECTAGQIGRDMEAAGYGKQSGTRIFNCLKKERRLVRSQGNRDAFAIKITARGQLDELYQAHHSQATAEDENDTPHAAEGVRLKKGSIGPAATSVPQPGRAKPALFIGSSVEGLKYARALEQQLQHHVEVTIWKDGVFGLGGGTLESLVDALPRFDFAALVLTPDDLTDSRNKSQPSARDNVIFELGLFMGRLGRFRTFIIYNQDANLKLPSDLAGVTPAKFRNRTDGNQHAQLSPPSTLIIDAIEKLGLLR